MSGENLNTIISGTTKVYSGYGRKLGYPTANIAADTTLNDGIYLGYADLDDYQNQPALIFIGTPTTVGDTDRRVEAHLLDITDKDYYGQPLKVTVKHFLRPNVRLDTIDELIAKIKADETAARQWFAGAGKGE